MYAYMVVLRRVVLRALILLFRMFAHRSLFHPGCGASTVAQVPGSQRTGRQLEGAAGPYLP